MSNVEIYTLTNFSKYKQKNFKKVDFKIFYSCLSVVKDWITASAFVFLIVETNLIPKFLVNLSYVIF
jgi:hypothetical protein